MGRGWKVVLVAGLGAAVLVASPAIGGGSGSGGRWVDTWTAMPQPTEPGNMPPPPFTTDHLVLDDSTLRQTVRLSVGGQRARLRFSNAFGGAPLPITRVSVAFPAGGVAGVSAIQAGTARPVTFQGRPGTVVPIGAQAVSDPLELPLASGSVLTVTVYLAEGQASSAITSHPGSRTTSYLVTGNQAEAEDLPGATPVDHWYFLSAIEVWSKPATAALVLLGDSLTDGRGSTTNLNNRWPDRLFDRLRADRRTAGVAIANQAAGGNRVLNDGLGPNALARLDRDVLARSGAQWLVVFEGVNDLGTAEATQGAQKRIADELIAAYDQIIVRAHAKDLTVYGATITPFGGHSYDDPQGHREGARQAVNEWIRTSGRFDAVIDFDRAVRDPAEPRRLQAAYDVGDGLHLSPAGYKALADAVPARLFHRS
ncbi:SGNH/GDSL hydrolase family protein [Nonomuraea basaltis]|uniref:SGNH/GDSL hydrolase family protein n=1 Tax=Nonomuraea basaltis TaxID=2495887 RepID=UPI00110C4BEE|nr:SGNH/GDSL hydrolase family protein [Nonomuraea basaltis]TMR93771.1 SGNH/GDSL hydrolase family protein [Nonomuraea basaltis]